MGEPSVLPQGERHPAVVYAWASATVSLSAEAQVERIRRHCTAQGWEIASELVARRFPELVELARRVADTEARRVVLAREALADIERRFPDVWAELRARFEARRVSVVAC